MPKSLPDTLLEIEISIKNKDWERAYELYKEIERNWEAHTKDLSMEEAKRALKIADFIERLLQENLEGLKLNSKYLELLKSYNKFR
ncbi:MAG: hypothetical protein N2327_02805 [Caldimicrobium sp.]|nr:hypothetical protein [Caldimicrobium sp.]MCX7873351.1 hypothetical protein [Caldimicrobium sp.]MDW8093411.1 hypothetical protein [Caldimicrobium sp.]